MTYEELREHLNALNPEQLAQDVTVYVSGVDEYYPLQPNDPVGEATFAHCDQLDSGHFYLRI